MPLLAKDRFICLDCETTGLDPKNDRVIEVAATLFSFDETIEEFETLINPGVPISPESMAIHNITDEMVLQSPNAKEALPSFFKMIGSHIIVGHGISLDIEFLCEEAKRHSIPCKLAENKTIDTLRLARLYGESPKNSLEMLRQHFNIDEEGAHRAKSDVVVNIEVFKQLTRSFKTTEQILQRLKQPILLKSMPLGKYKGRFFSEIPIEYLRWARHQNFDQDLIFSIETEIKKRRKGKPFHQSANPFSSL